MTCPKCRSKVDWVFERDGDYYAICENGIHWVGQADYCRDLQDVQMELITEKLSEWYGGSR